MDELDINMMNVLGMEKVNGKISCKKSDIPNEVDVSSLIKFIKPNMDNKDEFNDDKKCRECKGQCCKNMGCYISPDDLISTDEETLRKLLDTGFVSIDWWDCLTVEEDNYCGNGYYLRMRNIDANIVDPAYFGICKILTNTGCSLDFEHRPKGGRQLPARFCGGKRKDEEFEEAAYTKFKCVMDWYPYVSLLEELSSEY